MDIRRLGYGPAIPLSLLEVTTPAYLTDRQWYSIRRDDWLGSAPEYAEHLCLGAHSPLARIRPRLGQPEPHQPHYRLADYLEQLGRRSRRREIVPPPVWQALIASRLNATEAAQVGQSADRRMLYCHAIPFLVLRI
jgi:hypothetical protein